jgi:hypothetical protein
MLARSPMNDIAKTLAKAISTPSIRSECNRIKPPSGEKGSKFFNRLQVSWFLAASVLARTAPQPVHFPFAAKAKKLDHHAAAVSPNVAHCAPLLSSRSAA